ncbi:MAG: polysaccharide deacetylase family protein [Bacteroidetes bacterium]|nr:polysaccharide deacetylase family protein [Bacteroidota bacterium]
MVSPPFFLRLAYPGVTWQMSRKEKVLYLTFDDGPQPEITNKVLDLLKEYNAKATFFCIGENVRKHPDLYKRILTEGHRVGNHSNTHPNSWKVSADHYIKDVEEAGRVISSDLFRPPYGKLTPRTLIALRKRYRIIMWDVITGDFDEKVSAKQLEKNVIDHAKNGSIIVFHDSVKAGPRMLEVLPKVLRFYSEGGYVFRSFPK